MKLPLKKVLKSGPIWALMVANTGSIWAFMTITTYGPTYLKVVHGFNIREVINKSRSTVLNFTADHSDSDSARNSHFLRFLSAAI